MNSNAIIADVKAFRQKYGASMSHCARLVGLTPQGWAKKEGGGAPIYGSELARLARHYNTSLREAFPSYVPTDDERILSEELQGAAA